MYGSLTRKWNAEFAQGQTKNFPRTWLEVLDVFNQHKPDTIDEQKLIGRMAARSGTNPNRPEGEVVVQQDASFAQKGDGGTFCYCCGSRDHLSNNCPKRESTPRDKWYVAKLHSHMQQDDGSSLSSTARRYHRVRPQTNRKIIPQVTTQALQAEQLDCLNQHILGMARHQHVKNNIS